MLASRLLAVRWSSGLGRTWPLQAFNHSFRAATSGYVAVLGSVLRYRLLMIALVVLTLGGSSLWMVGQIPQEILPRISTGQASLFAQFPPGTPLVTSRKVMDAVDEILRSQPETEYTFTTTGGFLSRVY